jgi:hypothetical protein
MCIETRRKTHLSLLKRGIHYNYKLQAAYNQEELLFNIIEECRVVDLMDREQFYINFYNSSETGLNLCAFVGGAFNRGKKFSASHRRRISLATLQRYKHQEERDKTSLALKEMWEDENRRPKRIISSEQRRLTATLLWQDPNFREKILKGLSDSRTEEWKQKISKANHGKKRNEEQRENYSIAAKIKYKSEEARNKTKEALNRLEVIEKRSNKMKEKWQDPDYRQKVMAARELTKELAQEKRNATFRSASYKEKRKLNLQKRKDDGNK